MKKVLGAVLAVVVLVGLGAAGFVFGWMPRVRPASAVKVDASPEKVARGRYLAESVSGCFHCHSQMDPAVFGTPPKPGTQGTGGMCLGEKEGFPGSLCATNLTSDPETGLGAWTDGEIIRAIREGVSRDGRPLMVIMPYANYRNMADADVEAIVAYLRTLPAQRSSLPPMHLGFPLNLLVRLMPEPLEGAVSAPPATDAVARGQYLFTLGGCADCHTPRDTKSESPQGSFLAGGQEFPLEGGSTVRSANLTPHPTGLGGISRGVFVGMFKQHALPGSERRVDPAFNTVMAWRFYAGMTEEDLGAIYDYLKTVPPVDNTVAPWSKPRVALPAPP